MNIQSLLFAAVIVIFVLALLVGLFAGFFIAWLLNPPDPECWGAQFCEACRCDLAPPPPVAIPAPAKPSVPTIESAVAPKI